MTFVFFALMGVMYFLTSYLQSRAGLLGAAGRHPDAADRGRPDRRVQAVRARRITARFGTKVVVANGLAMVAGALALLATADVDSGYGLVALSLTQMGFGISLAMAPATEAIMGSLPKAKAGIGSAMNDVVREVGGTLGVAVLGSILSSAYASGMDDATAALPHEAAHAATDSVGGAHEVAAQVGGGTGAQLVASANQAFVDAMTTHGGGGGGRRLPGCRDRAGLPPRARGRDEARSTAAGAPRAGSRSRLTLPPRSSPDYHRPGRSCSARAEGIRRRARPPEGIAGQALSAGRRAE